MSPATVHDAVVSSVLLGDRGVPAIRFGDLNVVTNLTCVMPPAPQGVHVLGRPTAFLPIATVARHPRAIEYFDTDRGLFTVAPADAGVFFTLRSSADRQYAVALGLNGINTITGQPYELELARTDYYVVSTLLHVDDWNNGQSVAQFKTSTLGLHKRIDLRPYAADNLGGFKFRAWPTVGHDKSASGDFDPNDDRWETKLFITDPQLWMSITGLQFKPEVKSARQMVEEGAPFYVVNYGGLPNLRHGLELAPTADDDQPLFIPAAQLQEIKLGDVRSPSL